MEKSSTKPLINRLKRIEGQLKGVQKMIEKNRSCQETLTQLAAARHALDEVGMLLITKSMEECLKESPANCEEAVEKALEIFNRLYGYLR